MIAAQDTAVAQAGAPMVDTSAQALDAMGLKVRQKAMQDVYRVVVLLMRNGAADASLSEIQRAYEQGYSKRIDLNRVSARVYDLKQSGWLIARQDTRPCRITGRMVHPVFAVARQAGLGLS
jgi:hypothetical protein